MWNCYPNPNKFFSNFDFIIRRSKTILKWIWQSIFLKEKIILKAVAQQIIL